MDGLSPVSISYKSAEPQDDHGLAEIEQPILKKTHGRANVVSSAQEALETLRNEPDIHELSSALQFLCTQHIGSVITAPSPLVAQVVQTLVTDVLLNFWTALQEHDVADRTEPVVVRLLLTCLRSVTGLHAILHRMKEFIQMSKENTKSIRGADVSGNLKILLQVLTALLDGNESVKFLWDTTRNAESPEKQKVLWSELLVLLGSGKILGVSAEAEHITSGVIQSSEDRFWTADSSFYSSWLGRNIAYMITNLPSELNDGWRNCAELFGKSLRLGHGEQVSQEIITVTLLERHDFSDRLARLITSLPNSEQKNFLHNLIRFVSKNYLSATITSGDNAQWWETDTVIVAAAANLIAKTISKGSSMQSHLIAWLTSSSGAGVGDGIAIRRAVVAALSYKNGDLELVLEKGLQQFGDQLYIRHAPILQQEVHAQVLLLCAGYIHRKSPLRLNLLMRSGYHLNAVSNRLATSSPRARFLGMVIGEAVSSLTDEEDKRMDFKLIELATPEAKWYKNIVLVNDAVGSLEPLKLRVSSQLPEQPRLLPGASKSKAKSDVTKGNSKIVAIEEVDDGDEETSVDQDDDGFTPYTKPDSDADDSDEDPTLITRNRPTAPVYIRDLIVYLRDSENYDKQKLALSIAPSLIRRKANFGTEVSSHAIELATLLVGLQDKYDIEQFHDMRLQGMIAILVAQPKQMGQWFAKTFFDGDYSLSQRASILTTIGLSARELGGFGAERTQLLRKTEVLASFPSKALPENMHTMYANPAKSSSSALESLSTSLTQTMIAPLATKLADKVTGPDVLKVRTFSSRLSVESKRKKATTNTLATLVSTSFFFPLTGRFFVHLRAYGSSRNNVVFQPHLLSLFVKTLSLLMHFSGPSALSLPQMTSEFWELLLNLRMQAYGDTTITEALLFAFLTVLELNEDKRKLVDVHGRELLEIQQWVEGVFGKISSGGGEEDEKVRMLAAAVLVRIGECVDKYQSLLLGDIASFHG